MSRKECWQVIIVDDSSPDGTFQVAKELKKIYGEKMILSSREKKLGLGSAYSFGAQFASGEFICIMDADLSHHPRHIRQLISKQEEKDYDLVFTTRYVHPGGVCNWNLLRKFISASTGYLARISLGFNLSDVTGSFRLYKASVFNHILSLIQSKGFSFQLEAIWLAYKLGYTLAEVPIQFVDRCYGTSKLDLDVIIEFLLILWYLISSNDEVIMKMSPKVNQRKFDTLEKRL